MRGRRHPQGFQHHANGQISGPAIVKLIKIILFNFRNMDDDPSLAFDLKLPGLCIIPAGRPTGLINDLFHDRQFSLILWVRRGFRKSGIEHPAKEIFEPLKRIAIAKRNITLPENTPVSIIELVMRCGLDTAPFQKNF